MIKEYREISTSRDLAAYRKELGEKGIRKIAMDFEAEFNLHVYGEHLCLIQVFDGKDFLLIDPLKIDKRELKAFLEMKTPVKVFFGADSDRMLVYKQYGIKIASLYDVQHLVEVLNLERKGLDAVLASQLDVTVEKKKKFQQYNWLRRPLDEEAKDYALGDVEHLFRLNDVLLEKIAGKNMMEEALFRVASAQVDYGKKSVPGIFKTPAYKRMSPRDKEKYGRIVEIREKYAKQLNVPPNAVLTKQDLVAITGSTKAVNSVRFSRRIRESQKRAIQQEILEEFS